MWREKLLLNIAWGKVMTHVFFKKMEIFEILFYKCRKSSLLEYRNGNGKVACVFMRSSIL